MGPKRSVPRFSSNEVLILLTILLPMMSHSTCFTTLFLRFLTTGNESLVLLAACAESYRLMVCRSRTVSLTGRTLSMAARLSASRSVSGSDWGRPYLESTSQRMMFPVTEIFTWMRQDAGMSEWMPSVPMVTSIRKCAISYSPSIHKSMRRPVAKSIWALPRLMS